MLNLGRILRHDMARHMLKDLAVSEASPKQQGVLGRHDRIPVSYNNCLKWSTTVQQQFLSNTSNTSNRRNTSNLQQAGKGLGFGLFAVVEGQAEQGEAPGSGKGPGKERAKREQQSVGRRHYGQTGSSQDKGAGQRV